MLVSDAFALGQPLGGGSGGASGGAIGLFLPLVVMALIFYFLLIRPQQQKVKQHRRMVDSLRRGDTVVTVGGLVGKITKVVDDNEVQVEISDNARVRVMRQMIHDVRTKGEPVRDTEKKQ